MSDKDGSVEMSEEIAPADGEDQSVKLSTEDAHEQKSAENLVENLDDEVVDAESPQTLMGQLKSKINKMGESKKQRAREVEVEVEIAEYEGEFMCGVVEGFYGRPWTTGQRKELFRRMKTMGMNTYLYGPKDDYKHRLYWRDLYSKDEADLLRLLVESAAEFDVLFVYAISPGLDMVFASPKELECLRNKLLQVQSLGCKAFALLFDDIDPLLCATDRVQYSSAASAQASVTNQMYAALDKPRFLFCPTEYCNSMAVPDVPNSKYLDTLGKELDKNISVMWTGPKVVSKYITVDSIKQLTRVLRRKVVIWDNIHANDYDPKRMFLGPYKGRSTHLIPHLGGVLTNPNCELESNYIAMHTLASWWKCYNQKDAKRQQEVMEEAESQSPPSPLPVAKQDETGNEDMVLETTQAEHEKDTSPDITTDNHDPTNGEIRQRANTSIGTGVGKNDGATSNVDAISRPNMPFQQGTGQEKSPMSSGVSSLAMSDESDTDSDYSSHDGYYVYSRHDSCSLFDHGHYDPEEALKEAVKSWLPYFSTVSLSHGKAIARSGPPLGALSQTDISLVSNATMGPTSLTTSVLCDDPIVTTAVIQSGKDDLTSKTVSDQEPTTSNNTDGDEKCVETRLEDDVDMSGGSPLSQTSESGPEAEKESETETKDVEMPEEGESMLCESTSENTAQDEMRKDKSSPERKSISVQNPDATADNPSGSHEPSCKMAEESDEKQVLMAKNDSGSDNNQTLSQIPQDVMSLEDVQLAVELFYLPYEHGKFGLKMVHEFLWLRNNIKRAVVPPNAPPSAKTESMDMAVQWMERAIRFEDRCSSIRKVCNKLLCCSNRALLYDLFPYFWDMKGMVSMLSSYVKWMGQFYLRHQPAIPIDQPETASTSSRTNPPFPSSVSVAVPNAPPMPPAAVWLGSDPEPWVFRGGLSGEFQRLLPLSMANDLFCQAIPCTPPTSSDVYTIRPYLSTDEKAVYNICLTTGNDGTDFADDFTGFEDLPGEGLVGGFLTLSPEYCFVVEDKLGICGYLVGTADAKSFWRKYEISFLPEIKEKYTKSDDKDETNLGEDVKRFLAEIRSDEPPDSYAIDNLYTSHPALMHIAVHRRVTDPTIASSMTVSMLSALKSHGIHGVHTTVRMSDCFMPDQYCRLGFREIRFLGMSPPSSPRLYTSTMSKDDSIIVFGRNF